MNENERYYSRVMGGIGMTMLFFLLFFNLDSLVLTVLSLLLEFLPVSAVAAEVLYQLIYVAGYFLCFCLPIPILKRLLRKTERPWVPICAPFALSWWFFPILFAGIAIILSASYFNASLVSIFDYSAFSSEMIWGEESDLQLHQIVLQFLVICVVPGFCEELLFRGVILSNCLPFGRFRAIFISSLLFSLMHQNAEQIFYAFVAGILLGILYERTRNLWYCIFLHIFNNFASVFSGVLLEKYEDMFKTSIAMTLFEGCILLLGILSLVLLIFRFASKRTSFRDGVFGRQLEATDFYAESPISPKSAVKYFFRPSMIIFVCLCGVQILMLIGLAVLYAGLA